MSWLVAAIAVLVGYDVVMRRLFHSGSVAIQELEWHLFAAIFLLGAGYTLRHDAHVRVDLLYRSRFVSDRQRLLIDSIGTLVFLIPFCALVLVTSLPFVADAYQFAEKSPDPGGLAHRWVAKALIPAGFALLLLEAVASLITRIHALCRQSEST